MSRRRYISTDISTDTQVNRLARSGGDFAAMLYTWLIPHADDDGIIYGDEEEIILQVIPGRRDKSLQDVIAALDAMVKLDLITWDREGRRILFPAVSFYKYQTYIREERRRDAPKSPPSTDDRRAAPQSSDQHRAAATNTAQQRPTPQNTADQRISPQNTVSHSHSHSHSLSPSHSHPVSPPVEVPRDARDTPTKRKRPATAIPDPFVVTKAMNDWADEHGYTRAFLQDATEYFCDWATSHDHRYADWPSVWRRVVKSRWEEQHRNVIQMRRA
jgi:hypothetical protein